MDYCAFFETFSVKKHSISDLWLQKEVNFQVNSDL